MIFWLLLNPVTSKHVDFQYETNDKRLMYYANYGLISIVYDTINLHKL
jgi:hypothetical protein